MMPSVALDVGSIPSIRVPNHHPGGRHCRRNGNNNDGNGGYYYGGGGPWSFYPWGPYAADYRVDYSVNTPSRQSNSPFQIHLNDGIHLSTLDSGYPGPLPAVGEYSMPQYPAEQYPAAEAPVPPPAAVAPMAPAAMAPAPMAQTAAPVDVDLVVGVQRGLRRLGYYRGVVNGISDASTRAAIRAYEANLGLPVTGVMSTTLMRALGIF